VNSDGEQIGTPQVTSFKGVFRNVLDVVLLLGDPRMLLMVPVCIFSGMEQSFLSGDFNADIVKEAKGLEWVGMVFPSSLQVCWNTQHVCDRFCDDSLRRI